MPAGYELSPGIYDEAFEAGGQVRPHYADLLEWLTRADLARLAESLERELRQRRVTFGLSPSGYFALDAVPRLLTVEEWGVISTGILQRARALDRYAADVYGGREIVAAGIVPERVIQGSADYEPAMRDAPGPRPWVSVVGFDLVRADDGSFLVLEDNLRMPSGIAYAVAAREALGRVLPDGLATPTPIEGAFTYLAEALRAAGPPGMDDPVVVILSEGAEAAGWYEHERLAGELGAPVVTMGELARRGDRLFAQVRESGEPIEVDVVYVRTEEDRLTDPDGELTALGRLILEPCRAGRLACVNPPGAGVGDDKLAHAYVEDMVRFYLGEEPILGSVTTYDLGRPEVRERAMSSLDELVIKPRGEMGGEGVVVFSEASENERREALRELERRPEELIAQRRIDFSRCPTIRDGRLEARHVDLRPYVIRSAAGEWALPGGLTRVALERGSLIVNSGQGGGVKDSWVIG